MSLEHLFPFAGDHAIQSAVVVVEWAAPGGSGHLAADHLQEMQRVAVPKLDELGLGTSEILNVFELQMVPGKAASHSSQVVGGFKASRPLPTGGEARSVMLTRENCIIQIDDYTRWAQAKNDIREYLNVLLPLVGKTVPILHLTLQFNDVFLWKAPSHELIMTEVFKQDTTWLPPHVFSVQNLWHSHHGYFCDQVTPCNLRQLNNVNVSRAMVNNIESVQALVAHRASFANPIWVKQPLSDDDSISQVLDRFHDDNKKILTDLFSDDVLRSINLLSS
ncbi:MAG: hypothetical protein CRU78_10855 [Candidatus Accumulibacter phosphatis]|jgi:uncharacterized protein (TIGR04255 family)|uniref:TIGR04255 family protein n=1 Tax=Candidatus Accumulibacter phosphatis TaxID=327160 RepID=A0A6A7RTR6_9PROT|nr:hypothetical protein [Candidatus Accumulibacter phosphatis]